LKSLKGLRQMGGDSGAYRMLLFAGDHPVLPVNASVERTARRLGYGSSGKDFKQAAKSVRDAVGPELPSLDQGVSHRLRLPRASRGHDLQTGGSRLPYLPASNNCPVGKRSMRVSRFRRETRRSRRSQRKAFHAEVAEGQRTRRAAWLAGLRPAAWIERRRRSRAPGDPSGVRDRRFLSIHAARSAGHPASASARLGTSAISA
jgi:hypothetical protein